MVIVITWISPLECFGSHSLKRRVKQMVKKWDLLGNGDGERDLCERAAQRVTCDYTNLSYK